tara:strand:- start:1521 stop:1817 length:297 start_codon:yes stop_codon:yes gene_type:complete
MECVFISDFTKELREELIVLVFQAYYPNNKKIFDERFIKILIGSSIFLNSIYNDSKITSIDFDNDFGKGTLQDLVDSIRLNKFDRTDILESLENINIS